MTTTSSPSTEIAIAELVFTPPEQLALAGFAAGYTGLTREAYALDLRQFTSWCQQHRLRLFQARRADIECFARDLETRGRARATVTRRLCTIVVRRTEQAEILGAIGATHIVNSSDPDFRNQLSAYVNPPTALGMLSTMRREGHSALVHTSAASNLGQMLNKPRSPSPVPHLRSTRSEGARCVVRSWPRWRPLSLRRVHREARTARQCTSRCTSTAGWIFLRRRRRQALEWLGVSAAGSSCTT